MDAAQTASLLETTFAGRVDCAVRSPKRLYVRIAPETLLEVFGWLRNRLPGLRLATSTGIDLRDGVGVFHHFAMNGSPLVVTVKVTARKPTPSLPSLAAATPAADWIEREIAEMLGVEFAGHPDPRRFLKAAEIPDAAYPLRRDFDRDAPGAAEGGR